LQAEGEGTHLEGQVLRRRHLEEKMEGMEERSGQ